MSMSSPPPPPPLELLDEYWFFSNTLATNSSSAKKQKPPHLPCRSPSKSTTATLTGGEKKASAPRRLLRTPSLPSSRGVGMRTNKDEDDGAGAAASANQPRRAADEVEDDDLNWSSIYEGVLRTRMAEGGGGTSALRRAPSMPVPSDSESTPSRRLLRHSHTTLGRHTPKQVKVKQQQPEAEAEAEKRTPSAVVARCSKSKKQWKSSSDKESMEVQGFRDLGFVLDKEELRESLAQVLPGLKQQQQQTKSSSSQSTSPRRRPYLSESWHQVRRPELVRAQSAAEIKDQLRMWAQAVACNVRQEC